MLATCNATGAGKWTDKHSEFLRGRTVIITVDNDEVGREHGQQVAKSCYRLAKSVKVIELPGLPEKGDVSDWIAAGGTAGQLFTIASKSPEWKPTADKQAADDEPVFTPKMLCLADVELEPVRWLWKDKIALGKLCLIAGDPGLGKSFTSIDIGARVTTGRRFPCEAEPTPMGSVIFLCGEDDPGDTIRPRSDAAGADVSGFNGRAIKRRGKQPCLAVVLPADEK